MKGLRRERGPRCDTPYPDSDEPYEDTQESENYTRREYTDSFGRLGVEWKKRDRFLSDHEQDLCEEIWEMGRNSVSVAHVKHEAFLAGQRAAAEAIRDFIGGKVQC